MGYTVDVVEKNSIAWAAGIEPGDRIESVNGEPLIDWIDYVYFTSLRELTLSVIKPSGKRCELHVKKGEYADIGITFLEPPFGEKRRCANNCVFCFVDQMPHGMRDTLSVKDDDWRLSFVMGNYITLTNVSERELQRIIKRRVSPLYISVHAMDGDVRCRLMNNSRAGELADKLRRLAEAGIHFHCQIVMVPGINDGSVLKDTVERLAELWPAARSVAVVPVGLTKYRKGLAQIKPVDTKLAKCCIIELEELQKKYLRDLDTRFVFAADELYIRAGLPLPPYHAYEAFDQIENGVGIVASFMDDADYALSEAKPNKRRVRLSAVCGVDMAPYLSAVAERAMGELNVEVTVYPIVNRFFGETITVSGLLTAGDIESQLRGLDLGEGLIISRNMLREQDDVFLDDVTVAELEGRLGVRIIAADGGEGFVRALQADMEE